MSQVSIRLIKYLMFFFWI